MLQNDLFGALAPPMRAPHAPLPDINFAALNDFALLYTATEKGNNSGIRFALTREDALRWCSLDVSRGVLHGTQWAYFWTSLRRFSSRDDCSQAPEITIVLSADDGRWDTRIALAGCTKIPLTEFRQKFEPLGLTVVEKP